MQDKGRFLSGVSLAIGLVLAAWIGAGALVRIKTQDQTITVTGSARRQIVSDSVVWRANVPSQAAQMNDTYKQLNENVTKVVEYLKSKGVASNQIVVSSVSTLPFHPRNDKGIEILDTVSSYKMSQEISIRSIDVERITRISREATELINQGVLLESHDPEYRYTKLGDLKIQMLAEAAKDAKIRATQIAASTGAKVGALRSARMGVLQINPAGSSETSSEGNNDIKSIEKDVIAVVTCSFAVE